MLPAAELLFCFFGGAAMIPIRRGNVLRRSNGYTHPIDRQVRPCMQRNNWGLGESPGIVASAGAPDACRGSSSAGVMQGFHSPGIFRHGAPFFL